MNRSDKYLTKAAVYFLITVMILFCLSVGSRFLARQVLVKKLHMDNFITRIIFAGNPELGKVTGGALASGEEETVVINWGRLYPFKGESGNDKKRRAQFHCIAGLSPM